MLAADLRASDRGGPWTTGRGIAALGDGHSEEMPGGAERAECGWERTWRQREGEKRGRKSLIARELARDGPWGKDSERRDNKGLTGSKGEGEAPQPAEPPGSRFARESADRRPLRHPASLQANSVTGHRSNDRMDASGPRFEPRPEARCVSRASRLVSQDLVGATTHASRRFLRRRCLAGARRKLADVCRCLRA
jgi:hypothetical protein